MAPARLVERRDPRSDAGASAGSDAESRAGLPARAEAASVPAKHATQPDWLSRGMLRNLPTPLLIRSYLETRGARALDLLEENELPDQVLNFVGEAGLVELSQAPFFLHDRQAERVAVIAGLRRDAPRAPESARAEREELAGDLFRWFEQAGRTEDDFRLLAIHDREVFEQAFERFEPLLLVVWRAERSPLERAVARQIPPPPKLPEALPESKPLLLPFAHEGVPARLRRPAPQRLERHLSRSEPRSRRSSDPRPALRPDSLRSDRRRDYVGGASRAGGRGADHGGERRSSDTARPAESFHLWGPPELDLGYQVVGRTRGQIARKFYVRREDDRLKIAMLASRRGVSPDYALAFFDRLQFAEDGILAHRDLLRASGFVETATLSLEIRSNGGFRCIACGLTPIFYRARQGKAFLMPDSAAAPPEREPRSEPGRIDSVKIIEGEFLPGDALIIAPGRFARTEQREAAEKLRCAAEEPGRPGLAGELLGAWLDWRSRGRALLISRGGAP